MNIYLLLITNMKYIAAFSSLKKLLCKITDTITKTFELCISTFKSSQNIKQLLEKNITPLKLDIIYPSIFWNFSPLYISFFNFYTKRPITKATICICFCKDNFSL